MSAPLLSPQGPGPRPGAVAAPLPLVVYAAAVLAPGLVGLDALRLARAAGGVPADAPPLVLPAPARLPANERRRASQVVRLVMACLEQLAVSSPWPLAQLRSVFASDEGTGEVCQQMLEAVATTGQVSPLVFPNSVHGAPAGYFAIGHDNQRPATVVSLGLDSFASGLLAAVCEARAEREPVLLVAYDPAMTAPLDELLPVRDPIALALVIGADDGYEGNPEPVLARLTWSLRADEQGPPAATDRAIAGGGQAGLVHPAWWPSWLPARWRGQASARAMAFVDLLDAPAGTELALPLGAQRLTLTRVAERSA